MRNTLSIRRTAALMSVAVAALAAPHAAAAPVATWQGFYLGISGGYADHRARFGDPQYDWNGAGPFYFSDGAVYGGQVGYNWQAGSLVYGLEADFTKTWIDGGNDCCGHSINWLASVRGRAGLTAFDNRTLFYVTGGAAWADIDYSSSGTHSDTHFGWVAGAGVERALTSNLSARVEYLYYGFDGVTAPAGTVAPGQASLDPTVQTLRFGVNYKF